VPVAPVDFSQTVSESKSMSETRSLSATKNSDESDTSNAKIYLYAIAGGLAGIGIISISLYIRHKKLHQPSEKLLHEEMRLFSTNNRLNAASSSDAATSYNAV
jgi:hypothetical protein